MGGRGAASGLSATGGSTYGGHGSLQGLIAAMQAANSKNTGVGNNGAGWYNFHDGEGNFTPDYTDGNNSALLKWQGQTDEDKIAAYLAKLGKAATPAQDAEGYAYHQSPYQNMVIDQNLNKGVYAQLSGAEFDAYCQANSLTPIYRGWNGGKASKIRFENAAASHTGAGRYGEGYYFGDKSTAGSYAAGATTIAALSPSARIVDASIVQQAIRSYRSKTQRAFGHSGVTPGPYANNNGEAQMALKMGYNVIRTDWCYVVLTRDAVVTRL